MAHGRNIPFLPILEVFRDYYGITLEDDDHGAREKIAGRMIVLDQSLAETLPLVYEFLGVADPLNPAPRLDASARQRQLIGVMRQVIKSSDRAGPTVTMIEDLHWLDAASAEFLEQMVDARAGSRSLLLLNFRPEYRAGWMQNSWYRQIPLTPLGIDAVAELLGDRLGSDPSVAALAGPIHARTGGNPFFIEEIAESLIETGHLQGKRGAYRLLTPVETLEVPATVQAVLAARIDRLTEREKRLLQVASVIGKDFPEPLLAAVAQLETVDLKDALAALRRAEFIQELSIYPVVEYTFKHPLTQEVALGSQLKERRRHVHAAVGRAIEIQDAARLDERAALLAHHWEEAGEALAAARWHKRAAEWVGFNDMGAALHHWQRVHTLLQGLPKDQEVITLGIAACKQILGRSFLSEMGLTEATALCEEGQALTNAIGDRASHLYLSMGLARKLVASGDPAGYLRLAIENQRASLLIDDVVLQLHAAMLRVDAMIFVTRLAEALPAAEQALAGFPADTPPNEWVFGFSPYAVLSLWRAYSLTWMGRIPEAVEEFSHCQRLGERDRTPEMVGYAKIFLAEANYHLLDPDRALIAARQLEEIVSSINAGQAQVALMHVAFCYAQLTAERPEDAVDAARAALAIHRNVMREHEGMSATLLAMALLASGELSAAHSAADEAIQICARMQRKQYEALAHGVVARSLLRRDGAVARSAVEAALAAATALTELTGARTLAPSLLEWRAELAAVLGDGAERVRLLQQAQTLFDEIGAPLQAQRIAALLGASAA